MSMTRGWRGAAVAMAALAACGAARAQAQTPPPGNAAYQAFFTAACANASPQLAALCASGPNTNISTDSEPSLNPNQTAVAGSNALARAQALAATTEQRLEALRDDAAGKPGSTARSAFNGVGVFASLQGEDFNQDRAQFANERGFDGRAYRFSAGVDRRLASGAVIGLSLSYGNYSSDFDPNRAGNAFIPLPDAGGVDVEDLTLTGYAGLTLSPGVWLDASAGIGFSDYDFRRNAIFQASTRNIPQTNILARGSADGRQYHAALGLGYDAAFGANSLGAYVRGRVVHTRIDSYAERDPANTGLALNIGASRGTSVVSIVGVRASRAISASWGVVVPQARFEYEHEFDDDPRPTATRLQADRGNTTFLVTNDAPDRDAFNAGVGLLFVLPNGWMPYVDYEALIGYRDFDRYRLTAGLRVEF